MNKEKKEFQMSDLQWNFTEDQMAEMYPELDAEKRAEAAENISQYFRVVSRIYDRLKEEGKLGDVKLRMEYSKRNKNKPASQNEKDDTPTP